MDYVFHFQIILPPLASLAVCSLSPSVHSFGFLCWSPSQILSMAWLLLYYVLVTSTSQGPWESTICVLQLKRKKTFLDPKHMTCDLISLLNSSLFLNCLLNISISVHPPEKRNEHLPHARYCARYSTYMLPFNHLTNPTKQILLPQIYRYGK